MATKNLLQGTPIFDGFAAQGELTSNGTATVFPTKPGGIVKVKAQADNTGSVYIGDSTVTAADGTTDNTTGFELAPGDTDFFFVNALNAMYLIAATSGDGVTFVVYAP